jgi:RHS repeat-associated protein
VGDGLGSVRGMLDNDWPDSDVLGTRQYAPYGVPFSAEGTVDTPFGFTGEQVDGNDLVYLRARYYAPGLGIFASRDPWEGKIGRAMSLNKYLYTEANPVSWIDPTGKFLCEGESSEVQSMCRAINRAVGALRFTGGVGRAVALDYRLEQVINCDGTIKMYADDQGDATENLLDFLRQHFPVADIVSIHTTPRRVPLAILEALILIWAKSETLGRTSVFLAPITFAPSKSYGYEGETDWDQCTHQITVGYDMYTESIVHELGHEFDCQHSTRGLSTGAGTDMLSEVNHFIYYIPTNGYCNQDGQYHRVLDADVIDETGIFNEDVYLNVGDEFCMLSGIRAAESRNFKNFDEGFGARVGVYLSGSAAEVWADMFMNWVYDHPHAVGHYYTPGFLRAASPIASEARRSWMDRKMKLILFGG